MAAKKTAKKTAKTTAPKAAKRVAKKAPAKKGAAKKTAARKPAASKTLGTIAHTELVSADPAATKTWAKKTFSWTFPKPMVMPDGSEYHMFRTSPTTGGGIRGHMSPEQPGTIPYVEVANIKNAYAKALKNGAKEMLPPTAIAGNMGWMAIVHAPGGIAIGLWSEK